MPKGEQNEKWDFQLLHCQKLGESEKEKVKRLKLNFKPSDYYYCSEEAVERVWKGGFALNAFKDCPDYVKTNEKRKFDLFGELIK